MVVRQPVLHLAAVLAHRENGHVLAALPPLPQAYTFARQPEQVTLAGELGDQHPKAFPRLGWEVGQCGGVEHAEGGVRWRRRDRLREDSESISGYQGLRDAPELYFNIALRRSFLDSFVGHIIPLVAVAFMLFATLMTATRDSETASLSGFNTFSVLTATTALFFVVLLGHIQLRDTVRAMELMYLEYFYFTMYLAILLISIHSLVFALNKQALWIVHVYGFLVAGFLVTMGRLGDRVGPRRLLLIGASAFAAVSAVAAFSTEAWMLIAARALLGVAGATLMPSLYSLLRIMFRDENQRRTAIAVVFGAWAFVVVRAFVVVCVFATRLPDERRFLLATTVRAGAGVGDSTSPASHRTVSMYASEWL